MSKIKTFSKPTLKSCKTALKNIDTIDQFDEPFHAMKISLEAILGDYNDHQSVQTWLKVEMDKIKKDIDSEKKSIQLTQS